MIRVEEALTKILEAVSPLGLENVNIVDGLGRVIEEDIRCDRAIPPEDRSAMDGYALRAGDTERAGQENPVRLEVIEEIPAGNMPAKRIGPGQAARIMTGAPLPDGADAVVRMEDCRRENGRVAVLVETVQGRAVRRAGEDLRMGEGIISRGDLVRSADIGTLAALGRAIIPVHRRPLVAVVSTGNELAELDETPAPGKSFCSNSYALAALVGDCGAVPLRVGIARDRREDLILKFRAAMKADLIVSTGGVSVGDYDLVRNLMNQEGNRLHFWRVAMAPGRPLAFGALGKVPIVGLPGNPVAAMVCFEQFVRPAILKMLGHKNLFRLTVRARLGEDIAKKSGIRHFIWGKIQRDGDHYTVVGTGNQGFGMFTSMARANGLIVLPEETTRVRAGETVMVQLLDDSLNRSPESGYWRRLLFDGRSMLEMDSPPDTNRAAKRRASSEQE